MSNKIHPALACKGWVYGLIGFPIKHSLSPAMHNAAFRALKINAQYKLFALKEKELKNFLSGLSERNILGLNVTVPYKERALKFLDRISPEAKLIGAVNTIKVSGDKLYGYNTDGIGFLTHLKQGLRFNPQGKCIAIIGAGGAARAISVYLARAKPQGISLFDIDKPKLDSLVENLRQNFKNLNVRAASCIEDLDIPCADLLVNATAVGMHSSDPNLVPQKFLHPGMLVYDLIYNPPETKLISAAKKIRARVANGLGMLLHQGALSFELWTGKKAPLQAMRQALEGARKK